MEINAPSRLIILVFAVLAFFGPNGLYVYTLITQPELNDMAMANPVALAFMIEAFMLFGLFLWYVYHRTQSWGKVLLYLVLTFMGSLAFSFPLFLYQSSRK